MPRKVKALSKVLSFLVVFFIAQGADRLFCWMAIVMRRPRSTSRSKSKHKMKVDA
ncbi:hypothetical protein K450DRAFT_248762 [Umbelopsis ramanniana AG]|uniref:Uncharacterized protein n=1 Tax=Umbelopsis ramanniana AG TaxID=1314678 RepID=A0AAD5E626_UMBRA|nr:uncharacterized protein K450DRAFT_248762 [Umbelopsis ramanniana AG]KAI8578046.1 hypothetical protein K450DRAFT_248762 [Umbelopsis ramanniana AG]